MADRSVLARRPDLFLPIGVTMSAASATRSTPVTPANNGPLRSDTSVRRSTETKASFKTTEFFTFLAAVAGILIAGLVVDDATGGGFDAKQVWLYVTILTVGYMISRGLAKSGSREPYTEERA